MPTFLRPPAHRFYALSRPKHLKIPEKRSVFGVRRDTLLVVIMDAVVLLVAWLCELWYDGAMNKLPEWAALIEATPVSVCSEVAAGVFSNEQKVALIVDYHRKNFNRDDWRNYVRQYKRLHNVKEEAAPQLPPGFGQNTPQEEKAYSGEKEQEQEQDSEPEPQKPAQEPQTAASIDWGTQQVTIRVSKEAYDMLCDVAESIGSQNVSQTLIQLCEHYACCI
jgi:hypothetical protein